MMFASGDCKCGDGAVVVVVVVQVVLDGDCWW